jgi:hypothetical protein
LCNQGAFRCTICFETHEFVFHRCDFNSRNSDSLSNNSLNIKGTSIFQR